MDYDEFAEKIRTVRKTEGLTPGQVADALAGNAEDEGQGDRDRYFRQTGYLPDPDSPMARRRAKQWFAKAWDGLVDFGATDDIRDACRVAYEEAFFSEPRRPGKKPS